VNERVRHQKDRTGLLIEQGRWNLPLFDRKSTLRTNHERKDLHGSRISFCLYHYNNRQTTITFIAIRRVGKLFRILQTMRHEIRPHAKINMAGEIIGDPEDQSSANDDDEGTTDSLLHVEDKADSEAVMFSIKFHVETVRLIAFTMFLVLILTNMLITELYINKQPSMDPTKTVIYGIFGFNHPCNWFDHNPARLVAVIQIPFVIIPMCMYVFLFHVRLMRAYNKKKITRSLLLFSSVVSPFNAFAMSMLHIWFVNPPDGDFGFIGHYVPYAMFEYALALMASKCKIHSQFSPLLTGI
jgi:hypothetical protein